MASEYAAKIVVSLDSLRKIQKAQRHMYDSGIVNLDSNTLASLLSPLSTVLGLAFVTSSPAGIAAGVVGIATSMTVSARAVLQDMVYSGYWNLGYMDDYMVANPKYDLIQIKLPFIEYVIDGKRIRFITGKGVITGVHSGSGWQYSE